MGSHIALHQRVTVGCSSCSGLAGNHTTAAALVVNNKTLLELIAPALGDSTAYRVAPAASGHRHDIADGFARVGRLCQCQAGCADPGWCGLQQCASFHGFVPVMVDFVVSISRW